MPDLTVGFILPAYLSKPNGGYTVVYEYASRLAARGFDVVIAYQIVPRKKLRGLPAPAQVAMRPVLRAEHEHRRRRVGSGAGWHPLPTGVRERFIAPDDVDALADLDIVIATSWHTAALVADAPGEGFHLVQGDETWDGDPAAVRATWRLPLHKIVIARWLEEIGRGEGVEGEMTRIPNGLDLTRFRLEEPIEARDPRAVGMLWHSGPWKGAEVGLEAITRARREEPGLRVTMFGKDPRPAGLPAWVTYHERLRGAALRAFYNAQAVYVHPSISEGWGLPAAEAMACGAAVVSSDNAGIHEFGRPGETVTVVPVRDAEAMAQALLDLVRDADRRIAQARAAHAAIQQLDWDRSADALAELLHDRVALTAC